MPSLLASLALHLLPGAWTIALVPAVGGLLVGLLWQHFVREERYHGVAGVMEASALAGGRLEYWLTPVKTIAAALSIGAGASVGPEDPSVQIGANLGSLAGTAHFSDDWVRTLLLRAWQQRFQPPSTHR